MNVRALYDEKYSADGLEAVLAEKLSDARLRDSRTRVLVTAYDIERRAPVFFRSVRAREEGDHDFLMRDVARATSAAPTYFEPARLPGNPPLTLVDGGVFANNPGMCAYVDRHTVEQRDEVTMVSLGTGELTRPLPYEQAKDWGLLGWGLRVLDVVFDGVSDTVDYQLGTLLGDQYLRLQTELNIASDDLDDADDGNIADLRQEAEELIEENRAELDGICARLTA